MAAMADLTSCCGKSSFCPEAVRYVLFWGLKNPSDSGFIKPQFIDVVFPALYGRGGDVACPAPLKRKERCDCLLAVFELPAPSLGFLQQEQRPGHFYSAFIGQH
jgi:hypothetical protein